MEVQTYYRPAEDSWDDDLATLTNDTEWLDEFLPVFEAEVAR